MEQPRKFIINVGNKEVPALQWIDGREYLSMKNAAEYIGLSRYTSDKMINSRVEAGTMHQYQLVGKPLYVPRDELDALRQELAMVQPLSPKKRQGLTEEN